MQPIVLSERMNSEPLEEGKLADIIVLDRNPFDVSVDQIPTIQVELTMMDGEVIYTKNGNQWLNFAFQSTAIHS